MVNINTNLLGLAEKLGKKYLAKEKTPKAKEKTRRVKPSNSGLTQILQRDKNGKPKLSLTPIKKTAVNTSTQKDYWDLMRVYECGGWRWKDNYLGRVRKKFGVSDKAFYQSIHWGIISTQEFYDKQKITSEMLNEINIWFDENGK